MKCPHEKFTCTFKGTANELTEHLHVCPFEPIKALLEVNDRRVTSLESELQQKDAEIGFLRSMLSNLSQKLDSVEKDSLHKFGQSLESLSTEIFPRARICNCFLLVFLHR